MKLWWQFINLIIKAQGRTLWKDKEGTKYLHRANEIEKFDCKDFKEDARCQGTGGYQKDRQYMKGRKISKRPILAETIT